MSNHYVWAGGFLLCVGYGVSALATFGLQNGKMGPHEAAAHGEAVVVEAKTPGEPNAVDPHARAPEAASVEHGAKSEEPLSDEALREQMKQAAFLYQRGRPEEATRLLERLVELRPDHINVWINLGIARLGLGNPAGAREAFAKALEIDPYNWHAVAEQVNVELEAGDLEAALGVAEKIPAKEGMMGERLVYDARWTAFVMDPRVAKLRLVHGVPAEPDAEERLRRGLEAKRAAAELPETATSTGGETVTVETGTAAAAGASASIEAEPATGTSTKTASPSTSDATASQPASRTATTAAKPAAAPSVASVRTASVATSTASH